jgi:membrane protein implicated in regulation of membrane protease activity
MMLTHLVYWHWFILGVALMIAEALAPGSFLIWFGLSALVTGTLVWAMPTIAWQVQCAVFAVMAVIDIVVWRQIKARRPDATSHPSLNQRGQQYLGQRFVLNDAIVNGQGRLIIDDTQWKILGPDMPVGTSIIVEQVDGAVFRVARAN